MYNTESTSCQHNTRARFPCYFKLYIRLKHKLETEALLALSPQIRRDTHTDTKAEKKTLAVSALEAVFDIK